MEGRSTDSEAGRATTSSGIPLQGRDYNDPRESVLDTLQVSMHPNVGLDEGGTRIIMVSTRR